MIVDPRKKREVTIEEPLAGATEGTQEVANARPDAFLRITMRFAHAIVIVIPCVLANGMTDSTMNAAGFGESGVPSRLIGVHDGVVSRRLLHMSLQTLGVRTRYDLYAKLS